MNNRSKGHGFERAMAERLRTIWPECYTTRFKGTLWLDHCGVDLLAYEYNILTDGNRTHSSISFINQFLNYCNNVVEIRLKKTIQMLIINVIEFYN